MNPGIRLSLSLVASLLMWLPTVPGALAAGMAPEMIAGRYLLALVVARIGVGMLSRIISGYAASAEAEPEPEHVRDPHAPTPLSRRREDLTAGLTSDSGALTDDERLTEALEDAHDQASLVAS